MTASDYLSWERGQVERHEYCGGEVFAMSGGTPMDYDTVIQTHGADLDRLRAALQTRLGFPQGFWHPEDLEAALDVMSGCLDDLGLGRDRLPAAIVQATIDDLRDIETDEDEDAARRHQIGKIVQHVNRRIAAPGGARLRALANSEAGWGSGEPVWLLLTSGQRHAIVQAGIATAPADLEAEYGVE